MCFYIKNRAEKVCFDLKCLFANVDDIKIFADAEEKCMWWRKLLFEVFLVNFDVFCYNL